jgi:hypothetical protein
MKYFIGAMGVLLFIAVAVTAYDWATCDGTWGGTFPMACETSRLMEKERGR